MQQVRRVYLIGIGEYLIEQLRPGRSRDNRLGRPIGGAHNFKALFHTDTGSLQAQFVVDLTQKPPIVLVKIAVFEQAPAEGGHFRPVWVGVLFLDLRQEEERFTILGQNGDREAVVGPVIRDIDDILWQPADQRVKAGLFHTFA